MSSLVINAATLDDDYNNNGTNNNYGNNGNNASCRKNQTYKNKNAQKIDKTMLHQLYTSNNSESEETMGDFAPVQKQMQTANFQQGLLHSSMNTTNSMNTANSMNTNSHTKKKEHSEEDDDVVDKINTDATYENELYKQYIHNYNNSFAKDVYSSNPSNPASYPNTNNDLLKRLDKILYLLEEEKNDQSHLITEELILYVFLGVFIIYVLDSFVRAGKYVR